MRLSSGRFYGSILREISVADFTLTETLYPQSLKLPPHTHGSTYFCFVLEGGFSEFYEHHVRDCQSSTMIFHPVNETHSDHFHSKSRCFNIQMDALWMENLSQHSNVINGPAHFRDVRISSLAMRLYREFHAVDDFSFLTVEGLLLEMMAEASRHRSRNSGHRPPSWLRQAREILDRQFAEGLRLMALSKMVGIHPVHLAREFRRFYHCPIGDYVRKRRIEFACQQLSRTDIPLGEIAQAAGFFDQSHFARTFKKFVGLTASEYRATFGSRRLLP